MIVQISPGRFKGIEEKLTRPRKLKTRIFHRYLFSMVLFVVSALIFCSPASAGITAGFSGTPQSGVAPLPVTFTDQSTGGPTGWAWYFGDENWTATGQGWTQMTANPGWFGRYYPGVVALDDGSIIMMGGAPQNPPNPVDINDTWRSKDEGATWTQINASAGWSARYAFSSVVLPDNSIVVSGGSADYTNNIFPTDTWRSTDGGNTWTQQSATAGWTGGREYPATVALPDGDIVMVGGQNKTTYFGDVWRSTDKGVTWNLMNASAFPNKIGAAAAVVLHNGNILVMGGYSSGRTSNIYVSSDEGATWTKIATAPWKGRDRFNAVVLPDGSIVIAGGYVIFPTGATIPANDVWRSADGGVTWTQINAYSPWLGRDGAGMVSLPNGDIVIVSGQGIVQDLADVWRLPTASSTTSSPAHTYTTRNTSVTLSAYSYSAGSANSTTKVQYIEVYPLITSATLQGDNQTAHVIGINGLAFNTSGAITVNLTRSGYSNVTLTGVTIPSQTLVTGTVPIYTQPGLWNITVINNGFTAVNLSVNYLIIQNRTLPTVTAINRTGGVNTASYAVTITGTNFNTTAGSNPVPYLSLGGTKTTLTLISNTSTSLVATVPSGLTVGTYTVGMINPPSFSDDSANTLVTPVTYNVTAPDPVPAITSIGPTSGQSTVTVGLLVQGSGFNTSATTTGYLSRSGYANVALTRITMLSPTQIYAQAPGEAPGVWNITLIHNGNTMTLPNAFTSFLYLQPGFGSINLTSGVNTAAYNVTITGFNFNTTSGSNPVPYLSLGGVKTNLTLVSNTSTSLVATIPSGLAAGTYTVGMFNPPLWDDTANTGWSQTVTYTSTAAASTPTPTPTSHQNHNSDSGSGGSSNNEGGYTGPANSNEHSSQNEQAYQGQKAGYQTEQSANSGSQSPRQSGSSAFNSISIPSILSGIGSLLANQPYQTAAVVIFSGIVIIAVLRNWWIKRP